MLINRYESGKMYFSLVGKITFPFNIKENQLLIAVKPVSGVNSLPAFLFKTSLMCFGPALLYL